MSKRKKIIDVAGDGDAHKVLLKVNINDSITLVSGNIQVTAVVSRLEAAPGVVK